MTTTSSNNRTIIINKPSFIVDPEDKSIRKGKTTYCINDPNGVKFFKSAKEAADFYGIGYANVIQALNGYQKTANGLMFVYANMLPYKINEIMGYIMELKANELTKAEQIRQAEEKAARAEAETQRVKEIYKKFIDELQVATA